jgi:hypothetical protein
MKINVMDIYELLKEENQRFWDFLDFENLNLNPSDLMIVQDDDAYIIEEIENS